MSSGDKDSRRRASSNQEETDEPRKNSKRKAGEELSKSDLLKERDTELVYEDPYGDEFETDEDDQDITKTFEVGKGKPTNEASNELPGLMVAGDKAIFRPGIDKVADGETLICDESAYDILQRLSMDIPSLSFDFICPGPDGGYSNMDCPLQGTYPVTIMLIRGTQSPTNSQNKLQVLKLSNMRRNRARNTSEDSESGEGDSESDDDDEQIDDGMADGIMENVDIKFDSVVNRLRAMPQKSNMVAVWGESGRVSIVNVAPALDSVNRGSIRRMSSSSIKPSAIKPLMSFNGHRDEGYGLDWSRVTAGRLASGSTNGGIYLWEMAGNEGGDGRWTVSADKFRGHRGSVEDIQWSPVERNVFATCGTDRSIRFWDAREYRKAALAIVSAHSADTNVISWNRNETHLMASGGDDGCLKVWDLRVLNKGCDNDGSAPAAEFSFHKAPVTSVEWHPRDASMLAASSEDGSLSIWDLAVERDAEEELRDGIVLPGSDQYPPQLMFVHMGQNNIKELHWHPACNSLVASTAEDGMNVFKAANITLPS